jgi:hypothetical protein
LKIGGGGTGGFVVLPLHTHATRYNPEPPPRCPHHNPVTLLPFALHTHPHPHTYKAFLALFNHEGGDDALLGGGGRGLRGKARAAASGNSTTVLLDGLAMGAIYGYFTTLKFEGNQVGRSVCVCLCVFVCVWGGGD